VHAFSKALSAVKAAVLFPVQNLASTWAALQALDAQTAREDLDAQIQLIEQNARVCGLLPNLVPNRTRVCGC